MRRSQINAALRQAERTIRDAGIHLPPFATLDPATWDPRDPVHDAIRLPRLGWDVTDFGRGQFERYGLTLLTLRNGYEGTPAGPMPSKPYAEKLMLVREGQRTPMHTHLRKIEDIVHRAGVGRLVLELRADVAQADRRAPPLTIWTDGRARTLDEGERLELSPGESVTLLPGCFHAFWAEGGNVIAGEVSTVNDDETDNVFVEPLARFTRIDEDEAPYRWLVNDYVTPAETGGATEEAS